MPERIPTLDQLREQFPDDPARLEEAAVAARDLHAAEMTRINQEARNDDLTASQQRRWDAHDVAEAELRQYVAEQRLARVAASRADTQSTRMSVGAAAMTPDSLDGRRSVALRFADEQHKQGMFTDSQRQLVQDLVDDGSIGKRQSAAEFLSVAGDPAYLRAFSKLLADPARGHMEWTPQEADAYRAVATWKAAQSEARTAMATSGYVLPSVLDPAIMLTNDGSNNPLRRLARVVTTSTNTWRGITSAGATAEWKTEGAQAADGTPTAAEVEIPVFLADVDAIFSYEVQQDAIDLVSQLQFVVRDAIDNLQAVAFTTGNGTTAPQGFVTGLDGTSSEVAGNGSETLASSDPVKLQNALGARFSPNAAWMSNIAIANTIRFYETTNGALMYPELRQSPPQLLGKPWYECSNMDGTINAAATSDNFVLAYGDWQAGYVIVDHIGATVEILPGYGANNRPTGQRHLFVTSRHGAEVVRPQALRLLNVATTA
ncbi:major capsid protein [Actinoplanes philippinensis]|uniref:Phage major capsid protein, HK97 family n=1 Tax=Actinoplanes philippinensis TaxID=35752 RepID=A0A1I2IUI3_9ACTN|nr:phage major capsid protein [Actinoplanes philippinensis]GIE79079.1 major capsid protein [Actinoplanes philippinensis]SFF44416.1 phage major capsid protein, HK97 family [Actinoplanes philippinensis]